MLNAHAISCKISFAKKIYIYILVPNYLTTYRTAVLKVRNEPYSPLFGLPGANALLRPMVCD